jgi:hypothetical protein
VPIELRGPEVRGTVRARKLIALLRQNREVDARELGETLLALSADSQLNFDQPWVDTPQAIKGRDSGPEAREEVDALCNALKGPRRIIARPPYSLAKVLERSFGPITDRALADAGELFHQAYAEARRSGADLTAVLMKVLEARGEQRYGGDLPPPLEIRADAIRVQAIVLRALKEKGIPLKDGRPLSLRTIRAALGLSRRTRPAFRKRRTKSRT